MRAELTGSEYPVITPEVMEYVGRHIVYNACIRYNKNHTEEAKEHENYKAERIYIPASKLNAWFSSNVNDSYHRDTAEAYRDAGYDVLYHAIANDPIEDVLAVASGEKTQVVIYWLELEQFFDHYIEALVEQANLPDKSIIVDHSAIEKADEVIKEGLITVPVLIRKEMAYTISECYSLASFLRKMIDDTGQQSLDADALWDVYEAVTSYTDQYVEDWDIVAQTTHYMRIDSSD